MDFESVKRSSKNLNDWTWHFSVSRLCSWYCHDDICMFERLQRLTIAWNILNEIKIEVKWFYCRWSVEKNDK